METIDLTTKILEKLQHGVAELKSDVAGLRSELKSDVAGLRSEVEGLKVEVSWTRERFRETLVLLDQRMDRLHTRMVESEVRATTAHHETQRSLARLMDFIDAQSGLEGRVERCELDIVDLKDRVFQP